MRLQFRLIDRLESIGALVVPDSSFALEHTWRICQWTPWWTLPRRRALHGRLSLGVRDPQFHAGVGLVGVDRELRPFEQRLHAAIAELLRRRVAVKFCG